MENHRSSKINLQATVDLIMEYDGVIMAWYWINDMTRIHVITKHSNNLT